jgi:uncharacterized protein YndB with AHSA1/START domain
VRVRDRPQRSRLLRREQHTGVAAHHLHGRFGERSIDLFGLRRAEQLVGVSLVTVEFKRVADGTELDFRHEQFFDEKARDDHKRGWTGLLENLARFVQD